MSISSLRNTRSAVVTSAMFLVVLLFLSPVNAASGSDVEARNKQIVTEAFDRWAAGGTTFFSDVLSPDVVWTIKGSGPSAGTFHGRDAFVEKAVRPFVSRLSTPIKPISKQVWADGDHVIIQWDGEGVASDGQAYKNSYAWIFHMRDGKAVGVIAYLDLTPYDDVLQRIPAPAAG
ncbi:nuclear transport factor 2 family protein [Pseudomonas subflava]|uniref:nuclear transport factor 2 family protein n=1 Tax=Pseudomonas subflava TaxID=2952933 RepID=UPI002079FF1E|nr:nuclear transport factor 2 family protein [Pseudomonas subflava]